MDALLLTAWYANADADDLIQQLTDMWRATCNDKYHLKIYIDRAPKSEKIL